MNNSVLKLRQEKGITQEDLAKAVGVTRQTIYALEQGNYTPSVLLSLRIAEFFKLPVEKIFQLKYDK
ncbi:MAG: transcriptional regulator [Candidatus Komeilibacteria bacterium CG10_big_fil_rev_8_21_14_0_10_41_13]|uniref:Transcriptional regulator n=1 Tax=Candidatus Komeilibacteria bacterium CG10_big_fil_rev_8_21_14_0_10_41_13 TaxID=1974476 RepID=A0A2M6WC53_9BACT|nr:MAG: transcriptional regulator [Candidatus Komeilibacteria bacterium CG10_big_fil_rev_8_21_14_0_10_41_13]